MCFIFHYVTCFSVYQIPLECNQTFTSLKCYAPPLGSSLSGQGVYLFPGINYTIMMDGALGPVGDPLKIGVVPNPVFTSIDKDDLTQTIGSVKMIRINVSDLVAITVIEVIVM